MVTVATLKLILDIALGVGIFYLCIRVGRGPQQMQRTEHLRELESSLTRLLKEADNASFELSSSLGKKQKQLEELLFDIETVEHRLNKGLDEAEEARKNLRRVIDKRVEPQAPVEAEPVIEEQPREVVRESSYKGASEQAAASDSHRPVPKGLRAAIEKNIEERPIPPKKPVAPEQQIEVAGEETVPAVPEMKRNQVQRSLEDVYAHCEELIRAGKSIGEISRMTQMSEADVETLKGILMVESDIPQDDAGQQVVEQDARLGVLSGKGRNPIGRTTQVL